MVAPRALGEDMQANVILEAKRSIDVDFGTPTPPPSVKKMRGSMTPDEVEKLISSGLFSPSSPLKPTLSNAAEPGAERNLAIVVYDPPAILADGVSGVKKFLPTPLSIRDCPLGFRIRGGRMVPPVRRAAPKPVIEKRKKSEKPIIDLPLVILSDSDSGGEQPEPEPRSSRQSAAKPVTKKAGSEFPSNSKKRKVYAQRQGETVVRFNPLVDELKEDADPRVKVKYFLKQFDNLRRRFMAEEEARVKDSSGGRPKRPDVRAFQVLKEFRNRVNGDETIYGEVPGVEVGDYYYYRTELLLISVHKQSQGGIDYITKDKSKFTDKNGNPISVAVSVIASGGYADDIDEGDVLTYTGQGGNINVGNRRQAADQELVRGNLALKNCCDLGLAVRVIRGCDIKKSPANQSPSSRIYYYDGLYDVVKFYQETGAAGCKVWKFKLVRKPGQGALSSNLVLFRGKAPGSLPPVLRDKGERIIAGDLSLGLEPFKVRVVGCENDGDDLPNNFEYMTSLKYSPRVPKPLLPKSPCTCSRECRKTGCKCIALNGDHVYNDEGGLLRAKRLVYECGPQCRCMSAGKCTNRVSQKGLRYELEVFKTKGKGWGVRSSYFIPQGSFVCEYIGEIIHESDAEKRVSDDEYMFDLRVPENMKRRFGHISGIGKNGSSSDDDDDDPNCEKYTVDANRCGNLARFINHSCDPNLFVQCVLYDHHDHRFPHIMLFASEHISPFKELTYDYGYELDSILGKDGKIRKKECFCGSKNCKGRMY
ncbi:unnamed protein product [Calypogeia fissa]